MAKARFILCEDGSYLYIRNVTRLFLAEDTISKGCSIKASVIGPAMPFLVSDHESRALAAIHLQALIDTIEESL